MAALASCTTTEIINGGSSNDNAIKFGRVSTRVDSASEIEEFSVWATVSSIGSTEVSYLPILENERVYRDPVGSENWTYDNTQRWLSNSIFYFFAVYPRDIEVEQLRIDSGSSMMTGYLFGVTADGSASTKDILVATNVTNTNVENYATTVPLTFIHLLSKINLTVSQNTDIDSEFEYYVTKVTITGLVGNDNYMAAPFNGSIRPTWLGDFEMPDGSIEITPPTPITLTADFSDEPVCLRKGQGASREANPLKVWGEDGVMLVPQNIAANGVKIRVDYLYDTNPNDTDLGQPKFVEGYIPAITWQSNTAINYNIAIANTSNIVFNQPSIVLWGSPNTGGTVIIK